MKPHKHAELIKAWADGAEIEQRHLDCFENTWSDWYYFTNTWKEKDSVEYRIKPKPKPDVVKMSAVYLNQFGDYILKSNSKENLKLTFDGETGELKSAEVLK